MSSGTHVTVRCSKTGELVRILWDDNGPSACPLCEDTAESGESYDVEAESARLQVREVGRQIPLSPKVLLNRRDVRLLLTVQATQGIQPHRRAVARERGDI